MATIWNTRSPHVYDGIFLNHVETRVRDESIHLIGAYTPYRFYYAQKQQNDYWGFTPIAVSGIIRTEDHLIFARRSPHVTSYPNWIELVPSGAIDADKQNPDGTVNYQDQLRQEFEEETRVSAQTITAITPFAVVHDPNDPTFDIVCQIHVQAGKADFLSGLAQSGEYHQPQAVACDALSSWAAIHAQELMPISASLLGLLQQSWPPAPTPKGGEQPL